MGLSSPGIGSNLDVNGIVSQLMATERRPLTLLQQKENTYQAQLSAYGQVKSALSTFQSAVAGLSDVKQLQPVKATPADATVFSATAAAGAVAGNYAIEVTKLAQAQKLVAAGQATTTTAIGGGAASTVSFDFGTISGGTFDPVAGKYTGATFTSSGNGAKSITIDASNNSLAGIRDAINKGGFGVTASIVNDGSATPNRLVLTNSITGVANSMKITVAGDAAVSGLLSQDPAAGQSLSETMTAQNAQFKVDGLSVSKSSNHVTDVLGGVTLDLLKVNPGAPTTMTVANDTSAVVSSVTKFVNAYNAINKTLSDASAYDPTTKSAAILNGDSTIRSTQAALRQVLSSAVTGGNGQDARLSDVGISFQKDGTLAVDTTKMNKVLTTNFNDVAGLFATAGKATDPLASYTASTSATQAGSYAVNVTQLATQAGLSGSAAAGLTITAGTNDALSVNLNGITSNVTLKAGTYATAAALALEVQSEINGNAAFGASKATVTQNAGVLSFSSSMYGAASSISVNGNGAANLLGVAPVATAGKDVAGTINGVAAAGSGQSLIGAKGNASEGLGITVAGGALGSRGTVNFSKGYATQFNDLVSNFTGSSGRYASRTDGLGKTIATLKKNEDSLTARLTAKEADLRKQFTALDTKIGSMSSTASYLTQQLAQISAFRY